MIEKPFLLNPEYETLIHSGAFRQRVYKKFAGMTARDLLSMACFMNFPTVITFIVGVLLDRHIFLATAIWGGVVAVVLLIVSLNWIAERSKRQRADRLAFDSDLVTGRIITCERKCYGGSNYQVEVRYAVETRDGKEVQHTQAEERDDLLNAKLPPPGWPVLVLMVDESLYVML